MYNCEEGVNPIDVILGLLDKIGPIDNVLVAPSRFEEATEICDEYGNDLVDLITGEIIYSPGNRGGK